ncbi:MAG: D-alanine--D-alanine ligase [Cyanophyceae cyanobacterium]
MQIVVLAGGLSPERDVSWVTGRAIKRSLEDLGHQVTLLDPGLDLPHQLWQQKQQGCEFVWIALHGGGGENGTVQAMLDWLELPYQGSGALASGLAMDKNLAKRLFRASGIPTPTSLAGSPTTLPAWEHVKDQLGSPVVVKPADGGSSVGISVVSGAIEWGRALEQVAWVSSHVLVETYIPGQELTISILDGQLLPAIEIVPHHGSFYDYEAKYEPGGSRHLIPPQVEEKLLHTCEQLALQSYEVLGCLGLARVDLRLHQRQAWILEVNTLPGMTPTSLCPDAAAALGWSFDQLVARILTASLPAPTLPEQVPTHSTSH